MTREPNLDHGLHHAWTEGYVAVNRNFAAAVLDELDREPGRDRLLPRLPPLPRAAHRARRAAGRAARALRPHPVAGGRLLARAAAADPARRSTRGCSRTTSSGSTRRAGAATSCAAARTSSARRCDRSEHASSYGGREALVTAHPISVDAAEFDELAESAAVLAAGASASSRPARRSSSCASIAPTRRRTSSAASARSSSTSTRIPRCGGRVGMLALLDPSRQDIPEYAEYLGRDPARGAARQRPLPASRLDADRARVADNFHAVGRGVQAVRRAARERDLRRAEPRREGGAARQRARRRAVLSENAGAHEELGDWAITVNPFDVAGQARGAPRGARAAADERRARHRGRSARTSASTTSRRGSQRSSRDLDRAPRGVSHQRASGAAA